MLKYCSNPSEIHQKSIFWTIEATKSRLRRPKGTGKKRKS